MQEEWHELKNIWKNKLNQYQEALLEILDKELEKKGYEICPGVISQTYMIKKRICNHECKILFDIINRKWSRANIECMIECMTEIVIENDIPAFNYTEE